MKFTQFLILSAVACLTSIAVLLGVPQAQEKSLPPRQNPSILFPDYSPFEQGAGETPKYFP
mgnify:CR=1 FL=1